MFGLLNTALVIAIWLLVPLMTADCISRERREGTLGLLFLTPLKSWEVVIAKGATHILRAFTLVAAAIPVVMLPVLMGGVSLKTATQCLVIHFYAAAVAVAGSLTASAIAELWWKAQVAALVRILIIAGFIGTLAGLVISSILGHAPAAFAWLFIGVGLNGVAPMLAADLGRVPGSLDARAVEGMVLTFLAGGTMAAVLGISYASLLIRRRTTAEAPTKPMSHEVQSLYQPIIAGGWLRHSLTRSLDRNPIDWLHQRTTTARLSKWGLCLALVVIETVLSMELQLWERAQPWICDGYQVFIMILAASSFMQERETGALELLLVTPLRERDLLWGRLWGIWRTLFPSLLLLSFMLYVGEQMGSWNRSEGLSATVLALDLAAGVVSLPVIGLYFSLRCRHFMTAWLLTLGIAFSPVIALQTFHLLISTDLSYLLARLMNPLLTVLVWSVIPSLALTVLFYRLALAHLRQRRFIAHAS